MTYYEKNKDKIKKRYLENKDKLRQKYLENKDEIKQKYLENKDEIKQKYLENKDEIKQKYLDNKDKRKIYLEKNKDILKIKYQEYHQKYYELHKEEIDEKRSEISNLKREIRDMKKEEREKNKEEIEKNKILKRREYQKSKKKTDPLYKLKCNLRSRIGFSLKNYMKKSKTETILGIDFVDFRKHIEGKFEPWMNWENYGLYNGTRNYGWDIDHIIPISRAKNENEMLLLNHYTNLQPLCSFTNRCIKRNN